jgi:hypothetical protein
LTQRSGTQKQISYKSVETHHLRTAGSSVDFIKKSFYKKKQGDYKKNNMSAHREKGRGNKRARVTRGSRNPKNGKKETLHCAQT